jgi:hypothetical protein
VEAFVPMRIVINDTSCLIDLRKAGLLHAALLLNAMRLGRSPHIDFLGPWDHQGLSWLAERAQRWPRDYRARCWDPFLPSSLINEGTVSSIKGGSLIK